MGPDFQTQSVGATQVNPLTDQTFEQLQNETNFWRQGLQDAMGNIDPASGYNFAVGLSPELQKLALGATSPLAQANQQLADRLAPQAVGDVMQAYGGQNAIYSGGAAQAAGQAAGNVRAQLMSNTIGAQTNLAGNLMGSVFQTAPQNFLGAQMGQADLMGGLYSQGFGAIAQYGDPMFQPDAIYDANAGRRELFGTIAGAGLGFLAGGPAGGFAGAGLFGNRGQGAQQTTVPPITGGQNNYNFEPINPYSGNRFYG